MKKLVIVFMMALFASTVTAFAAPEPFSENWIDLAKEPQIKQEGIYEIYSAEQLSWVAKAVNEGQSFKDKEVVLCADIDLDGKEWTPIGAIYLDMVPEELFSPVYPLPEIYFSGSFRGNGYKISNMHISNQKLGTLGLFGIIRGALITDLNIASCELIGYIKENSPKRYGSYVAALAAGSYDSEISACTSSGSTYGHCAGGVIGGAVRTSVTQCSFAGSVTGEYQAGGLAGVSEGAKISQCRTQGTAVSGRWGGGLIDTMYGGIIENCHSEMSVNNGAGLIGSAWGSQIKACYWNGTYATKPMGGYEDPWEVEEMVVDIYWDSDKSGIATSFKPEKPLTTEQMKTELPHGFDSEVWGIVPGATYPYLKAFGENVFDIEASQSGEKTLEVEIIGDASDCVLVGALYAQDGRLLNIKTQSGSATTIEFTEPIADNEYKVFVWSDLTRMIPLSSAK